MNRIVLQGLLITIAPFCWAQKPDAIIQVKEVNRVETILASDDMQGRVINSQGIERAADFIAAEFKKAGLQPLEKAGSFRQEFDMITATQTSLAASFDGVTVDPQRIVFVSSEPDVTATHGSGYETRWIKAGGNIFQEAFDLAGTGKNLLVMVDSSMAKNFPRLVFFKRNRFRTDKNIIFLLGNTVPKNFTITAKHDIKVQKMANIAGMLPGKNRKQEYVIFSGHYDHLGTGKPVNGDSIYNGANDDASGITAVIMLARYFALKNNERTLVFAAFTAEEAGGFGSQYFSRQMPPEKVMAMINIEMIGTESKWGPNSAYITGYEKTDMGSILQRNLEGSEFRFYPDPYPEQQLFYRSDNATLARLGVPAHTLSTSKMDNEPNYHKVTDEVSTLDMENMTRIIRSIALSAGSIISGKDTPTRVKPEDVH